jgi:ribosomal protein L34
MVVSQDDIKSWKDDGWTFRVKTVKGKKYITRRKGKQEKSLGRFDEKLWKLIHRSSVISKRDLERLDAQKIIGSLVHEIRGFDMSLDCSHIVDGFCFFWRFGDQPGFFRIADRVSLSDYYREVDFGGKPSFWVFKAVQFYCRGCSGYVRAQPNDRPRELILS